ncbi:MAG: response regulator [Methanoregula sp.]|jgi:PAS domain S-box-containing protein
MLSVLILDDQQEILDVTRTFLERFGDMKVESLRSAKEGLTALNDHAFDAIIVDYDMPEINGIEFLKIVRSKGDTTPIIIFTGVGREYAAIEALNNGANFFLKKGDDINPQLRNMVHMIRLAVEGKIVGKGLGTAQRLLSDTINFFPDPAFVIDREGKVIAWNAGMAALSGVEANNMIGRKDHEYAIPFFGRRVPMLIDLVFENEEALGQYQFNFITKEQKILTAWTKVTGENGADRILWMKSEPLTDSKGTFVGAIGIVRDVTDSLGKELVLQAEAQARERAGPAKPERAAEQAGIFDRLLGKAKAPYLEGLRIYYREGRCEDAIPFFTRAIEIDPSYVFAYHDRGICYREIGRDDEALRDIEKALQLSPGEEEIIYSRAETLRKIGILRRESKIITKAIDAYNQVLEKNPNDAGAWNNLGICAKELGKEELSRQYFERAKEIVRSNKATYKRRNLNSLV